MLQSPPAKPQTSNVSGSKRRFRLFSFFLAPERVTLGAVVVPGLPTREGALRWCVPRFPRLPTRDPPARFRRSDSTRFHRALSGLRIETSVSVRNCQTLPVPRHAVNRRFKTGHASALLNRPLSPAVLFPRKALHPYPRGTCGGRELRAPPKLVDRVNTPITGRFQAPTDSIAGGFLG
jgi:hypothetical protein